jgi:hypothetical protein
MLDRAAAKRATIISAGVLAFAAPLSKDHRDHHL